MAATNTDANELIENIANLTIDLQPNINNIITGKSQTKKWRASCSWYKNGKSNECEKYQKAQIKSLIGFIPETCDDRFYVGTNEIRKKSNPMRDIDGFEYTEDFDGKVVKGGTTFYFNLKFCCDSGGAQTRTLRLVYDFIKCQADFIIRRTAENNTVDGEFYFINILDGDTCSTHMKQMRNSIEKYNPASSGSESGNLEGAPSEIYEKLKKYIFIGDMLEFSQSKELLDLLVAKDMA